MAARERGDECLFGVDLGGISEVLRGGRGDKCIAVLEFPRMVAGVVFIGEVVFTSFPV